MLAAGLGLVDCAGQLVAFGGDFLGRGLGLGQFGLAFGFAALQFSGSFVGGLKAVLPAADFLGDFLTTLGARLALAAQLVLRGAARGRYLYWMTYTPGAVEPAMMEKFNGLEVSPGSCGWGNFDIMVEVLEGGVGAGPWVMGGRFTAADVLLGSSVNFMRQFGLLGERPVLNAYLERCLARPAYQAALAREGELEDR